MLRGLLAIRLLQGNGGQGNQVRRGTTENRLRPDRLRLLLLHHPILKKHAHSRSGGLPIPEKRDKHQGIPPTDITPLRIHHRVELPRKNRQGIRNHPNRRSTGQTNPGLGRINKQGKSANNATWRRVQPTHLHRGHNRLLNRQETIRQLLHAIPREDRGSMAGLPVPNRHPLPRRENHIKNKMVLGTIHRRNRLSGAPDDLHQSRRIQDGETERTRSIRKSHNISEDRGRWPERIRQRYGFTKNQGWRHLHLRGGKFEKDVRNAKRHV